ncbi:unnamed protein product [Caenorhabditis nigoni]
MLMDPRAQIALKMTIASFKPGIFLKAKLSRVSSMRCQQVWELCAPKIFWYSKKKYFGRQTFHLDNAYAITYFKSQGTTVDNVILETSEKMLPGMFTSGAGRVDIIFCDETILQVIEEQPLLEL